MWRGVTLGSTLLAAAAVSSTSAWAVPPGTALAAGLVTAVHTGAPHRCDAVFIGPVEGCSLSGEWVVTATGRSEGTARKTATLRLGEALQDGADLQVQRTAGTLGALGAEPDQRTCKAVAIAKAQLSCFEEPSLSDSQICFADLADESCYGGLALDYVGTAWKMAEKGRTEICEAVDSWLVERGASTEERAACQVTCAREASVRCVPR